MNFDSGITIVPGTDNLAGLTLLRELEMYAESGIPPLEVLHMATLGAARVAGVAHQVGSIDAGKLADLVLIDGDPSQRLGDLRHTALVMKDGVLSEPDKLFSSVGVLPRIAPEKK